MPFEIGAAIRWFKSARIGAQLITLVRKGRTAETRDGIDIHAGSDRSPSLGRVTDADGGDPQDMLAIHDASLGTDTAPYGETVCPQASLRQR